MSSSSENVSATRWERDEKQVDGLPRVMCCGSECHASDLRGWENKEYHTAESLTLISSGLNVKEKVNNKTQQVQTPGDHQEVDFSFSLSRILFNPRLRSSLKGDELLHKALHVRWPLQTTQGLESVQVSGYWHTEHRWKEAMWATMTALRGWRTITTTVLVCCWYSRYNG